MEVTLASGVVTPGMYDFLMINLGESHLILKDALGVPVPNPAC